MTDDLIRMCIDCTHYRQSETEGHPEFARCAAPQNVKRDLVTGEVVAELITFCSTHRSATSSVTCGPSGGWFVPNAARQGSHCASVGEVPSFTFPAPVVAAPVARPEYVAIEKALGAARLDGYELCDLVDAITARAKELYPAFDYEPTAFKDALAAIEDNPKEYEREADNPDEVAENLRARAELGPLV